MKKYYIGIVLSCLFIGCKTPEHRCNNILVVNHVNRHVIVYNEDFDAFPSDPNQWINRTPFLYFIHISEEPNNIIFLEAKIVYSKQPYVQSPSISGQTMINSFELLNGQIPGKPNIKYVKVKESFDYYDHRNDLLKDKYQVYLIFTKAGDYLGYTFDKKRIIYF